MKYFLKEQKKPKELKKEKWESCTPKEFKNQKPDFEYLENTWDGEKNYYKRPKTVTPPVDPNKKDVTPPADDKKTDDKKTDVTPPFTSSGCIDVTTTGEDIINKGALVKRCQKGKIVEKIQERLKEHGYLNFSIDKNIDGIYGSRTEAMVDDFQKDHLDTDGVQLVDDGIVGRKTWLALNQTPSDKPENNKNTTVEKEKGKVTTDDKTKTTVDKAKTKLPDEDDEDDEDIIGEPIDMTSTDDIRF